MGRANNPNMEVHRFQLKVKTSTKVNGLYLSKIYEGIIYLQTE